MGVASWIVGVAGGLLSFFAAGVGGGNGGEGRVLREPTPEWVVLTEVPAVTRGDLDAGGIRTLLVSDQHNRTIDPPELFVRVAWLVSDRQSVQDGSDVSIDFDPSHQDLILHSITVRRDGVAQDRLDLDAVRVVERESELEAGIVSGYRTALLFLEDVRAGDVIEYSYTLRGEHPAFGGHFDDVLYLDDAVPIALVHQRVVWGEGAPLHFKNHRTDVEPTIRRGDGRVEYEWLARDTRGVELPLDAPPWFSPHAWVQVSDLDDWEPIVAWALSAYDLDAPPGPGVREVLDGIRARATDRERQALLAVRFVQDEIRYLGIELGEGSHVPTAPDEVLARRYGDCKDKSLLLSQMLLELGLEASPALVSWESRGAIAHRLPGIGVFDHVIVRARLDGREVWIDPTRDGAGGGLWEQSCPTFGQALVIAPGQAGLSAVPVSQGPSAREVEYRLQAESLDEDARLEVVTRYIGSWADDLRAALEGDPDEYARECRAYYGAVYPDLELAGPIRHTDDRDRNVVTVTEAYSIPGFWAADAGTRVGVLYALEIEDTLPDPGEHPEGVPLWLPYPDRTRVSIEARIGEGWEIEHHESRIRNPAFRLDTELVYRGAVLRLTHELVVRRETVEPGALADYADDVDRALDEIYCELVPAEHPVQGLVLAGLVGLALAGPVLLALGLGLALLGWRGARRGAPPRAVPLSILTRPRASFRWGLEHRPARHVFLLGALGGLSLIRRDPDLPPLAVQLALTPLLGVLGVWIAGALLAWLGTRLGGTGDPARLRTVGAWSQVVVLATLLPLAALRLALEPAWLDRATAPAGPWLADGLRMAALLLAFAAWLWWLAVLTIGVAEAHGFSIWRALATVAIAGALPTLACGSLALVSVWQP